MSVKSRFELSPCGLMVTDHRLQLMWAADESPKGLTHAKAEKYAADLRLGGFDDWRQPDRWELCSICDLTRTDPCIDTSVFRSNGSWVWTRENYASVSGCAWNVNFFLGYTDIDLPSYEARVRAVRSVASSARQ